MQRYLKIEILDLDDCAPKSVHEFSEGLVVCLPQTDQGGRGHAVRPASGVLHTKSFDKGVETINGLRWKSVIAAG